MAVKEKLIKLIEGLDCSSKKVQNKLDAACAMLKEKNTEIPDNQTGKLQAYEFLFLLFTSYPQTMTTDNYHRLETFIDQLEKNMTPRAGKVRR